MNNSISDFSMNFFRLDGKVAVVTGGNKGIGLGIAVGLAKAGADLFIVTHGTNWDEAKELIEAEGRKVEFCQANLENKADIKNAVESAIKAYGKIDILVNNAGTIRRNPLLDYNDEDWEAVIDVNLNSVYYMCHETVKHMVKQGSGKIINIASMLSFQGGKFVPPYTASKHGVVGITKAFANELADKNIQINAIAPGYVETDNTKQIREDEQRKNEILARIPANRWAVPADMMGAAIFLSSQAADYINGHVLAVDGGWLVR